jgi:hypothetical protein
LYGHCCPNGIGAPEGCCREYPACCAGFL